MEVVPFEKLVQRLHGLHGNATLGGTEPRVVVSGNFAAPHTLVKALEEALEQCRVFQLNTQEARRHRPGFISETPFVGPGMRHDPQLDYLPMRLSLVPRLFAQMRPPDAVLLHTSLPVQGKVSLGVEVNILPAAIERTRARGGLVVAQMNPHMPYTYGDAEVAVEDIDCAVEVDEPLASPQDKGRDDAAETIGERVAAFGLDGTTLQLGIGLIPTVAAGKMSRLRNLRVWSEMIGDGVLVLDRAGALDPHRVVITSFLFGSPELYQWANHNRMLYMARTETVNDPARIAAHPAMLSVNAAMQVDLFAQVNASYVNDHIHSGFGGQPDFVIGALHSVGGHAVVALHSWHDKTDSSSVVPILKNPATSFQHSAVISEHGCAEVFGRSQHAQAQLIINQVADPRARVELSEAAASLGLQRDLD
ncbi:MAG TPA: acetyl-CoA hydrolase/transferase C-terminal domain-containing protein [Acidimicrobiales bacterium]|nr:acetyl-CoA hydrolase/transferase C-terminal domain-containing protein [Acidimicrobiales bacterium]